MFTIIIIGLALMLGVRLPGKINFAWSKSLFAGRSLDDFCTERRSMCRCNVALFTLSKHTIFWTFKEICRVVKTHRRL